MSTCRVVSCVSGGGCLLCPVRSPGNILLALFCFILYSKAKLSCCSNYLLTFYFCIPLLFKVYHFFLVLFLEGLVNFHRQINLTFFSISSWDIDMDYCDTEWTEIILSFLRLCPSTAFQTLLLCMRATPFLLRDSCPQ